MYICIYVYVLFKVRVPRRLGSASAGPARAERTNINITIISFQDFMFVFAGGTLAH